MNSSGLKCKVELNHAHVTSSELRFFQTGADVFMKSIYSSVNSSGENSCEFPTLQSGATPLLIAAQSGHLEVVCLLLGLGADKEASNKVGAARCLVN